MAQIDIVHDVAPELSDDAKSGRFLGYAALQMNQAVWGTKYDLGCALLAAHMMTCAGKADKAGAVTQERVGDVSVSYAGPQSDDALDQTSYGRQFKQLRRTLSITPLVT